MNCREWRNWREDQAANATLTPAAAEHLRHCQQCAEDERLRRWSRQLLRAGELAGPPEGNILTLWAAIQRASQSRWESALSGSFRRLAPLLVAVSLLLLLVGALGPRHQGETTGVNPSSRLVLAGSSAGQLAPDLSRRNNPEAVLVESRP